MPRHFLRYLVAAWLGVALLAASPDGSRADDAGLILSSSYQRAWPPVAMRSSIFRSSFTTVPICPWSIDVARSRRAEPIKSQRISTSM